jgi:hypothetical protein
MRDDYRRSGSASRLAGSLQNMRSPSAVLGKPTPILRNCPMFREETTAFQQLINTNSEPPHRSAW